jgi:general stress protein YciG
MRKRDNSPVVTVGSSAWLESLRAGPPLTSAAEQSWEAIRQFMREIGRRGGFERCRSLARRDPGLWVRFHRRYRCHPNQVRAALVRASPEVRHYLRAIASRGGQARARKCSREQLKAIAAKGGRAKAAKRRQASSPAQPVAGKQE